LNEFDFAKISLSLERDLAPAENPLDAFRNVDALLRKALSELQGAGTQRLVSRRETEPASSDTRRVTENPPPAASKLATLQERLGVRLQDLEVVEGFDGLSVKPKKYLGDAWAEINEVMRSLGGKWQKGLKSTDGAWRIPK
jgi:hypothetical protein